MMEALQEYENDVYIAEFSRNISLINDADNDNIDSNDDINETEEIEENIRGRGRGSSHDHSDNEQTVQLPPPPFFNKFQHSKPLYEFTVILPRELLLLFPYSIFCLFFSLEQIKII